MHNVGTIEDRLSYLVAKTGIETSKVARVLRMLYSEACWEYSNNPPPHYRHRGEHIEHIAIRTGWSKTAIRRIAVLDHEYRLHAFSPSPYYRGKGYGKKKNHH